MNTVRDFVVAVASALIATVLLAGDVAHREAPARGDRECIPALTNAHGRVLAGAELERLRTLYALFGLERYLDFDYAIQDGRFVWLSQEPVIAVWEAEHNFSGYIRLPEVEPGVYDLRVAPKGVPLSILPQAQDGWPVCVVSRIVLREGPNAHGIVAPIVGVL